MKMFLKVRYSIHVVQCESCNCILSHYYVQYPSRVCHLPFCHFNIYHFICWNYFALRENEITQSIIQGNEQQQKGDKNLLIRESRIPLNVLDLNKNQR